jgi:acetolactate synthase-1/2/3 large subunit
MHTDDLRVLSQLTVALSGTAAARVRVPDAVPRPSCSRRIRGPGIRYRDAAMTAGRQPGRGDASSTREHWRVAIHYLPVRRDARFIVALGMGGMGYSFGAGVGVAFGRASARANGDQLRRRTVVIAGDGSFLMHGMEIHTALQYRLPVTFLLFDNHAHAMCVTREQLFYDDLYSYNRFGPSRFGAGLATMFPGLPSVDVDDIGQLPDALRAALDADGPSVVSVECSADEIPPFAAFLGKAAAKQPSTTKENNSNVVART